MDYGVRKAANDAARIIQSGNRENVRADVDSVRFKEGVAVVTLKGASAEGYHRLADATTPVLIIIPEPVVDEDEDHGVTADSRQPELDLRDDDSYE